jgi:outer membrane protein OmpA-like peptidoglycan-associated protein
MAYDIFISYRREGGFETAKHLCDLLKLDGYSVSFDIDTLRNGDFDVELLKRIDECTDFIIILNKGVFDRCFETDKREDWLRNELAYALKQKKNIITIRLGEFTGFPNNLPNDIAKISKKNGPKYDKEFFDAFYGRLKEFLKTSLSEPVKKDGQCLLKVYPNHSCTVWVDGELIIHAEANKITKIPLNKGTFHLEFISDVTKVDKYTCTCKMTGEEVLLEIDLDRKVRKVKTYSKYLWYVSSGIILIVLLCWFTISLKKIEGTNIQIADPNSLQQNEKEDMQASKLDTTDANLWKKEPVEEPEQLTAKDVDEIVSRSIQRIIDSQTDGFNDMARNTQRIIDGQNKGLSDKDYDEEKQEIKVGRRLETVSGFELDETNVQASTHPTLQKNLEALKSNPAMKILLIGHTDDIGGVNYNQNLGKRRAESIKDWLVSQGINGSRITVDSKGNTVPIVPGVTDENRAHNRRVEFIIVK